MALRTLALLAALLLPSYVGGAAGAHGLHLSTVQRAQQPGLQHKRKPASTKSLPEAEALGEQYREAVTSRFPKRVRVKVLVRNEKSKAVLDFKGIPLEQVSQLVAALTGELPPVREVRLLEKPAVG